MSNNDESSHWKRQLRAIQKARDILSKIDSEENNFLAPSGTQISQFCDSISRLQKRIEHLEDIFTANFEQIVNDVNARATAREQSEGSRDENCVVEDGDRASEEVTTATSTSEASIPEDYDPLMEMEFDVQQLEDKISNIEEEVKDDVCADSIGIPIDPADLIDYFTALKVLSSKRHFLKLKLYRVALDSEEFAEEADLMKKLFAMWNLEERTEVLQNLAKLEATLGKFGPATIVLNEEFNKDYPVEKDVSLLRQNLKRFLDRFNYRDITTAKAEKSSASPPTKSSQPSKPGKIRKSPKLSSEIDVLPLT